MSFHTRPTYIYNALLTAPTHQTRLFELLCLLFVTRATICFCILLKCIQLHGFVFILNCREYYECSFVTFKSVQISAFPLFFFEVVSFFLCFCCHCSLQPIFVSHEIRKMSIFTRINGSIPFKIRNEVDYYFHFATFYLLQMPNNFCFIFK